MDSALVIKRRQIVNTANIRFDTESLFCAIFLLITLLEYVFDRSRSYSFWKVKYILPPLIIIFSIAKRKFTLFSNKKTTAFFLVWLCSGIITLFYNHNLSLMTTYIEICYFIIAYQLLVGYRSWRYIEWILIIMHIWGFISIFVVRDIGASGNSSNYMSVYYLVFLTILAFQKKRANVPMTMIHPLLALFFSIFALGRGGIISTAALVVLMMFFQKKEKRKIYLLILAGAILALAVVLAFNSSIFSSILSRFTESGFDSSGRLRFWTGYINECSKSIGGILFGINIDEHLSHYLYYIPEHLHNSFLTYHGLYGLLITVLVIVLTIKLMIDLIKYRKADLLPFILAFLLRSVTDVVFGNYCGDIIIYMFAIYELSGMYKLRTRKRIVYVRNKRKTNNSGITQAQ